MSFWEIATFLKESVAFVYTIQALGSLINSFSSNLLFKGPIAHKQREENLLEMLKFAKNKQRLVCIVFVYQV